MSRDVGENAKTGSMTWMVSGDVDITETPDILHWQTFLSESEFIGWIDAKCHDFMAMISDDSDIDDDFPCDAG